MPNTRLFLIVAIGAVGFLLWQQWQIDYGQPAAPRTAQPTVGQDVNPAADGTVPSVAPPSQSGSDTPSLPPPSSGGRTPDPADGGQVIRITTDVLDVEISTTGGELQHATLLEYPLELKTPEAKVELLHTDSSRYFVAQSGLVSSTHTSADHRQPFIASRNEYRLGDGDDEILVPLTWEADGITVTKTYRFQRGSYQIQVDQAVSNASDKAWVGSPYRQLQRVQPFIDDDSFTNPARYSFLGAALYNPEDKYEKFEFEDLGRGERRESANAWAAMVQHYFVTAWIPPQQENQVLEAARVPSTDRFLVRATGPAATVAPNENGYFPATLFVGPKLQDRLETLAPGLELTVDYGIFTPLSKVLYWLLEKIHALTGNWGWAIVFLTVLVKAVFFKLSEAQYKSTAKLRKLQPRIQSLKERYGDDKQKFNMAMMEIYKTEKVNPLGGCLPILVQIPVFFALYWVLLESVELRQADFMLWINDLSSPDPYFVLPIINGAAMYMTTKLSPNPAADPMQQKIFQAMPLIFAVMFAFFQAGLVLYWTVNAVLSLAQQWVITRRIDAADSSG
ncbi:MAG: membrane protein insertase YidC [Xanthomonadales bacterium]|nr:membrane protein insertase YidC [Xanthomonadales bacterium]